MLRPLLVVALLQSAHCLAEDGDEPSSDELTDGSGDDVHGDDTSTGAAASWRELLDHDRWRADVSALQDPWPEHRPHTVECEGGWGLELDGIEIDTGACNYLTLQQPLAVDIAQGDPIRVRMWWQSLASIEPAEGHVAVLVDDELLWEEFVPIPGPADARSVEFPSPLSAPAGATLTLHLHNHGINTWHFHELSVLSAI